MPRSAAVADLWSFTPHQEGWDLRPCPLLERKVATRREDHVWNHSGGSGAVSVLLDGYSTSGRYCREFQQHVTIGGRTEQAYGTACQQPDGSWQVVSTGS